MNFKKFFNKTKFSVAILATLGVFILVCITTPKAFALSMNGSGTISDPYIITSAEQLSEIRDNLTASYKLANNIDLEGIDFIPIGNKDVPFTGTFDGSGYTIKNLKINQPNGYYVGLFGGTNNATINNLNISDANVVGKSHTGGLIGYSSDSNGKSTIISNCSVNGSSTVTGGPYTGGLVGYSSNSNNKSTISNCSVNSSSIVTGGSYTGGLVGYGSGLIEKSFTTTNVVAGTHVGGLVGTAESLTINECFTTGNIKSLNTVGGLVGSTTVKLKIENCYSLSNIEATHPSNSYAGGLFGISKDKNNTINCCYFAGTIKGGESYKGALVGNTLNVINNSFYDGVKASLDRGKSYEMSSRLTTGMARQQSYTHWNFDTIWAIDENASYPYLKNLSKPSNVNMILPLKDVETGTGSIDNPYIISTKEQLNNVKFDLTANYKLANDIDLEGIEFIPIGNKEAPFIGTFDGNGYTIQNLKINQPNESYVGLFGGINNATIKNLNISDANVVGGYYTGGLVGYSPNGISTISNCSVTGSSTITGNYYYTGGLVGYGSGLIEKSFATTNVVGGTHVGGLVGTAEAVTINECFTTGNIKALNTVGGLVGSNINELKMNNCYSLSNIEATHRSNSYAGGLFGISKNKTNSIVYCYFAGTIKGAENGKGGLIGKQSDQVKINTSYYDASVTGFTSASLYDIYGKSTSEMMQSSTFMGWDFNNIWSIDEGATYPYFKKYANTTPINLTAISNDNTVELSWNIVSSAKNYEVKRSLTAGGPYTTIATVPSDTNSYSDNDVIGGTTYYYIITALNSLGGQSNSNEVTVTPNIPKTNDLDAPTITSLVRDGGVYITWNEVENATGYNVKRSLTPGGPYTNILDKPTNECKFFDRSADKEIKYYYVVTAVNDNGESINSKEMCSYPYDLNISKVDNTVKLEWYNLSEGTSYSIKRSTTPNGPYTYIAKDININTAEISNVFTDNDINTGTAYYYVVETKLRSGEVQDSQEMSITP